jgi:stage V sporulation protein G
MEITEVKVFPIQEEKLKAFVSIVFDQCFMVNDIKIIQGRDGLFISMPSRKKKNGEFKDVAHPLNNETRRMIEDRILAEYDRVLLERGEAPVERGERATRAADPAAGNGGHEVSSPRQDEARQDREKTLEEVEELHLRDSFWSVT